MVFPVYKLICVILCVQDAHEILTTVLEQIRSVSRELQENGVTTSRYTCPVEDHLVFRLENTRTCRG